MKVYFSNFLRVPRERIMRPGIHTHMCAVRVKSLKNTLSSFTRHQTFLLYDKVIEL